MARKSGTMLWFNEEKGYGFIQSEDDERVYVAATGFEASKPPEGRCAGRPVTFELDTAEGGPAATRAPLPRGRRPPPRPPPPLRLLAGSAGRGRARPSLRSAVSHGP